MYDKTFQTRNPKAAKTKSRPESKIDTIRISFHPYSRDTYIYPECFMFYLGWLYLVHGIHLLGPNTQQGDTLWKFIYIFDPELRGTLLQLCAQEAKVWKFFLQVENDSQNEFSAPKSGHRACSFRIGLIKVRERIVSCPGRRCALRRFVVASHALIWLGYGSFTI